MMRRSLPAFVLLTCAVALPADSGESSPEALFEQGNAHYQAGNFAAAEDAYRKLIEAGADSGAVYYNLGNAAFKRQKLGDAIYFWEKAKRKNPTDPDVLQNLELTQLLVVDRIETPEDPFPLRLLDRALHFWSATQQSWILLLVFVLTNALFTLYLLTSSARLAKRAFVASLVLLCVAVLLAGSLGWKIYEENYRQEGIIVEQKVDVRSGPGGQYITVFSVHEGTLVRVRGDAEGWFQVSLPNGWNGWLPKESLRIL